MDNIDDIDNIKKIDPKTLAEPRPDLIHIKSQLLKDKQTYEEQIVATQINLDRTNAMLAKF